MARITGAVHEDQYTYVIISRSVLHTMRNISDEICREHHKNINFTSNSNFLCVFEKLQKVTLSFVMSVVLHGTTRLPLDGFS
jgi:hypothetical protein